MVEKKHETGYISVERVNPLTPSDIPLQFLIDEYKIKDEYTPDVEISPVKQIDIDRYNFGYDLSIDATEVLRFRAITIKDPQLVKTALINSDILTISRIDQIKVLDLINLGVTFCGKDANDKTIQTNKKYRYANFDKFVEEVNCFAKNELSKELEFSNVWAEQAEIIKEKHTKEQYKEKAGLLRLKLLAFKLKLLVRRIVAVLNKEKINEKKIIQEIKKAHNFVQKNICTKKMSVQDLFKEIGIELACYQEVEYSEEEATTLLKCYGYIIKYYGLFLEKHLQEFANKKVLSELFNKDINEENYSFEIKKRVLKSVQEEQEYNLCNKYNLNKLYCIFRNSFIEHVQRIVDENITVRKISDMTLQFAPSALCVIVFSLLLFFATKYNFTLLKEMWERSNLLTIFAILSLFAGLSALGVYRNTKKYKRPRLFKFSISTVAMYVVMTVSFFSMYTYYINRYDGYDDTFYYINAADETIIIDGLFDADKEGYIIPNAIDGLIVSKVSKKTFRKNINVKEVSFENSDATIEENCFNNCANLHTVTLGERQYEIGDNTFKDCTKLTLVKNSKNIVSIGNSAFENCEQLKTFTFGDSIIDIKSEAFAECNKLESVSLPKSLTYVSADAFKNCANISKIVLNNEIIIKSIKEVFLGSNDAIKRIELNNYSKVPDNFAVSIPNLLNVSITGDNIEIGKSSFLNNKSLQKVTINGTVTNVGDSGFEDCTHLENLECDNINLSNIGKRAFYNCAKLKPINLNEGIVSIGDEAFYNNDCINKVLIPSSVKSIGKRAFESIASIENIEMPYLDGVMPSDVFGTKDDNQIKTATVFNLENIPARYFENFYCLEILTTNTNIKKIGDRAFYNCYALKSIGSFEKVTSIGESALYSCKELEGIDISGLSEIKPESFYGCEKLNSITLENNISQVGDNAFAYCSCLSEVNILNENIKFGKSAFKECFNIREISIPTTYSRLATIFDIQVLLNVSTVKLKVKNSSIPDYFLYDCTGLINLTLEGEIDRVGDYAFGNCTNLIDFSFVSNLTSIGVGAFYNCLGLSCVNLSQHLTTIPEKAFYGCKNLEFPSIGKNVTSIGKEAFYSIDNITEITIPMVNNSLKSIFSESQISTLNTININNNPSAVSSYFFDGCKNTTTITGINNVSVVSDYAFKNCISWNGFSLLTKVTSIGDGAFVNCDSFANVVIVDGVSVIGRDAFKGCDGVLSISIPGSLTAIGDSAFEDCVNVSSIIINSENASFNETVFNGCSKIASANINGMNEPIKVLFPSSLNVIKTVQITSNNNAIPDYYFADCIALSSISINNVLNNIGQYAFKDCSKIMDFSFIGTINSLGEGAFLGCSNLPSIKFGDSITSIPDYAFKGCSKLSTLLLYQEVSSIGIEAFSGCELINSIKIKIFKNTLKTMFGYEFIKQIQHIELEANSQTIPDSYFEDCVALTNLVIDGTIRGVGNKAFKNCSSLSDTTFISSLTSIGESAFEGCSSFESVVFNSELQQIPAKAFYGCSKLVLDGLGPNITSIGDYAFKNCKELTKITLPIEAKELGVEIFADCGISTFNIYTESVKSITNLISNNRMNDDIVINFLGEKVIPDAFFKDCKSLTQYDFTGIKTIGASAFENTGIKQVELQNSIESVGEGVFRDCKSLTTVNLSTLGEASQYMFSNCENLSSVIALNEDIVYREYAFYNTAIKALTISSDNCRIYAHSFDGCSSLSTVQFKGTDIAIEDYAFNNCSALNTIDLTNVIKIGTNAFAGCDISKLIISQRVNNYSYQSISTYLGAQNTLFISDLIILDVKTLTVNYLKGIKAESLRIEGSIKKIEDQLFEKDNYLKSVDLNEGLKTIGKKAFYNCRNLKRVGIPESLETIEDKAFMGCKMLNKVELKENIKYVGRKAFDVKYTSVTMPTEVSRQNWHENWYANGKVTVKDIFEDFKEYVETKTRSFVGICVAIIFGVALIVFVFVQKSKKKKIKNDEGISEQDGTNKKD